MPGKAKSALARLRRDLCQWHGAEEHFPHIVAEPLENNLFEWHLNLFFPGIKSPLHGYMEFPDDYPFSAPKLYFSSYLPSPQVTHLQNKGYIVCLDMLEHVTTQRFYSGWSSSYSVESILAQVQSFLLEIGSVLAPNGVLDGKDGDTRQVIAGWKGTVCQNCGHTGKKQSQYFPPKRRVREKKRRIRLPRTSRPLWEMLYADVESHIFSFLHPSELMRLVHINEHIRHVLTSRNVYHWLTISCYHSHTTFGDFVRCDDENLARKQSRVFGVGFEPEYWENEVRAGGRNDLGKPIMTTKKKLNNLHVAVDVLCYKAFKAGVKFSMWKDFKFSHFLPLYLNDKHGEFAVPIAQRVMQKVYFPSISSAAKFNPILALQFLSKLMNTTVVSLMREVESGSEVQLFTSIKALQSYMNFYHLLLAFCVKYRQVKQFAKKKVQAFLKNDEMRNKTNYPDLGEFLIYLTVAEVKWDDIGPAVIREGFVRNVKWLLEKHPHLISIHESDQTSCIRLRQSWEGTIISKRLFMFQVFFLENICHINARKRTKLSQQLEAYNKTLGQVPEALARKLQRACREIFKVDDWFQFYRRIRLPCPSAGRLCHELRLAMVESDWKGYHRFVRVSLNENLNHSQPDLCLCSGTIMDLSQPAESKEREEQPALPPQEDIDKNVVDIAFSIDCFSGVRPFIDKLKQDILTMSDALVERGLDVRFAVVGYRDYGASAHGDWPEVTRVFDFGTAAQLKERLSELTPGGGGRVEGVAESWYQVCRLKWRRSSMKVCINVIGLAVIDLRSQYLINSWPGGLDPIETASKLLDQRVAIYTVGNQWGFEERSRSFYQGTAHMTGGLYLKLDAVASMSEFVVESTMEEQSLVGVIPMVVEMLPRFRTENPLATRDQLAYFIWRELVARGVTSEKIEIGEAAEVQADSIAVSECTSLRACYDTLSALPPSVGTGGGSGGGYFSSSASYHPTYSSQTATAVSATQVNDGMDQGLKTRLQEKVKQEKEKNAPRDAEDCISLAQTLRCVLRAEKELDRMQWVDKGCLYRMDKYSQSAAKQRFVERGVEYNAHKNKMKYHGNLKPFTRVEFVDHKTHRAYPAEVVQVDLKAYCVKVQVPELRNLVTQLPLTSARLRKSKNSGRRPKQSQSQARRPMKTPKTQILAGKQKKQKNVKLSWAKMTRQEGEKKVEEPQLGLRKRLLLSIVDVNCQAFRQGLVSVHPSVARMECTRVDDGKTLLHVACVSGDVRMINLLLEFGADPAVRDRMGRTPLDCVRAAMLHDGVTSGEFRNLQSAARRLFEAMRRPETRNCRRHIFDEVVVEEKKHMEPQKSKRKKKKKKKKNTQKSPPVVARGPPPDFVCVVSVMNLPWTWEETDVVELIRNVGLKIVDGTTVSISTISVLMVRADVVIETYNLSREHFTETLLRVSCLNDLSFNCAQVKTNVEFVERRNLAATGQVAVKLTPEEEEIEKMFDIVKCGDVESVQQMVEGVSSATLRLMNRDGNTLLHMAAISGRMDVVQLLLSLGADPMRTNRHGVIPLHTIDRRQEDRYTAIARLLRSDEAPPPALPVGNEAPQQHPTASMPIVFSKLTESHLVVKSALCVIPPKSLWDPIQKIRKVYDKGYQRWMPHINVLYPYVESKLFESHAPNLRAAFQTKKMTPFRVEFCGFDYFDRRTSASDPDPKLYVFLKTRVIGGKGGWEKLIDAVRSVYPKCVRGSKFKPHLTVAQMEKSRVVGFVRDLNRGFARSTFDVNGVSLISRSGFHTPFREDYVVQF